MQAASAEPKGRSLGPGGLDQFAHKMAADVLRSLADQEMAEELAAAVTELALREAASRASPSVKMADVFANTVRRPPLHPPLLGSRDYDEAPAHTTPLLPEAPPPTTPLLPEAPPSTPLLPELEPSRRSFTRKLKGGLAQVFLPAPPPPTPQGDGGGADAPGGAELAEQLTLSLSEAERNGAKMEDSARAKMEDLARALTSRILDWVFNTDRAE